MPTLLHPGVYVSEVPSGARSIEGAPTSTTIFVGETERGPIGPTKIKSRSDYERLFGGYFRVRDDASPPDDPTRVLTAYAIDGYYLNGGSTAYVLRAMDDGDARDRDRLPRRRRGELARHLGQLGLGRVPRLGRRGRRALPHRRRLRVARDRERSLVEDWDRLSTEHDDENYVVDVLKRSLYIRWTELDAGARRWRRRSTTLGSPPATTRRRATSSTAPRRWPAASAAAATSPRPSTARCSPDSLAGVDDAALLVAACDALLTDSAEYDRLRRPVHRLRRGPAAPGPLLRRRPAEPADGEPPDRGDERDGRPSRTG